MRAVEFNEQIKFNQDYITPEPKKGEALVKINMAGICNTDIEISKGYMGFKGILGHEFAGTVVKINSDDQSLLGKRVVGEINCGCGVCDYCHNGLERHCFSRGTLGIWQKEGCMADYITMPLKNLFEISDEVSDEEATFVEPIAAGFEILEQLHIKPMDKVIILGDGKLGLLTSIVLNTTQADVTLVGKHSNKLEIAERQGVRTCLLSDLEIKKEYDVVVDATGSINGFETAISLTRPRGVLVLKSTVAGGKELNLAPIVIDEITILGSRCGQFAPAVKFLECKLIDVKPLIAQVFKAEEAVAAFEKSKTKGIMKVLLDFR